MPRRAALSALASGALGLALLAAPAAASVAWSATAAGSAATGTATMRNASGFTAACTNKGANSTVQLRWTPSPEPYATGYDILRTSSDGTTTVISVPGATTSSHVDRGMQAAGLSFTYTIRTTSTGTLWQTPPSPATGSPSYTGPRGGCVTL